MSLLALKERRTGKRVRQNAAVRGSEIWFIRHIFLYSMKMLTASFILLLLQNCSIGTYSGLTTNKILIPPVSAESKVTYSGLHIDKVLALPVSAESNVLSIEWQDELWLLINQPGEGLTKVIKVTPAFQVESVTAIPIMASSVSVSEKSMVVSGSNKKGEPVFMRLNEDGHKIIQYAFPDVVPIVWPVFSAGETPAVAWVESRGKIETATLDTKTGTLSNKKSIPIEASTAQLYSSGSSLWAVWAVNEKIWLLDLKTGKKWELQSKDEIIADFSSALLPEGYYWCWTTESSVHWQLVDSPEGKTVTAPDLSSGVIKMVPGGKPLIWIQQMNADSEQEQTWLSTLLLPGNIPFHHSAYVYSVSTWKNHIVLINQSNILLLK